MKKIICTLFLGLMLSVTAFSQAKKPVIMVQPSDAWCERNGCVTTYDDMGKKVPMPDYQAALKNEDMRAIISTMADFMAENGFPLKSLEQELKKIQTSSAELSVLTSKDSGAQISESPLDRLRRTAKPDIILDMDFTVRRNGPNKQVSFNLTAVDAYTSTIISGNVGTGSTANAPMNVLLTEAVLSFKDNFLKGLQNHFDDMFANGREVTVALYRFDSSPVDFETEFNYNGQDAELSEIIDLWFSENAVQGRYGSPEKTENMMKFTQVRIPLFKEGLNGKPRAIDAAGFANDLVRFLKKEPYNLVVKSIPKGLGEVWLVIGEK